MEKILATKNNKIFNVSTSDLGVSDQSKEMVHLDIPDLEKRHGGSLRRRRQIHKVPPQLRRRSEKSSKYDPTIVSLGPYHHGKTKLQEAEEVKYRFLDRLTSGSNTKKNSLYDVVLEKIDIIRGCYADSNCVDSYNEEKLAAMRHLDSCFIVSFIEGLAGEIDIFLDWHQCLGVAALQFAIPDIMLLENQIPLQIIEIIVGLQRGKEGEGLIQKFLNWLLTADFKPGENCVSLKSDEEPPLHLLEACQRMLIAMKIKLLLLEKSNLKFLASNSPSKMVISWIARRVRSQI